MNDEVIRGRRLTNQESPLLFYPDLPMVDETIWNDILAHFVVNNITENSSQIIYTSSGIDKKGEI